MIHVENRDIRSIQRTMKRRKLIRKILLGIVCYSFGIIYFFPILYMFLTGFKTELQAITPALFFKPTLATFKKVLSNSDMNSYLNNSLFQVTASTLVCLLLGVPAAFALQFGKFKKQSTNDSMYLWFITTILLPPVAVLIPLYLTFNTLNLHRTPLGLLIVYVGFHLPLVVWMVHSFLADIPVSLIEASQIDGCTRSQQLTKVVIPLARTGIITAGLLVAVFIWNEFFLGFNLTTNQTATLPVYMSRFREQQGQFTAQLSASSTISVLPAILLGWLTQKSLVKGLTMGAVKG
jgi:sorbitol/mannitol transport system permease protein